MNKRIAILRGINVGGKRKILMADLKMLFEHLRFSNIETYIQSGNVIFDAECRLTAFEIEKEIEEAISNKYGFSVPVIVRSADEIEQSIRKNPFHNEKEVDITQLHLTFLKETPSTENCLIAESYSNNPDRFIIEDRNVFIICKGKYHQSKLTNNFFESKLKVSATTRNWKTVMKLLELSK